MFKDPHALGYLLRDKVLKEQLERIFWKPRGHNFRTSDQSITIEEMLTILRDWEQEKALEKRLAREELEDFKKRLYVLIEKAVFEGKSAAGKYLNPLIAYMRDKMVHVTWASFNWDCIFEASFWYCSSQIVGAPTYWRSGVNPQLAIKVKNWKSTISTNELLKLHGCVAWWMVDKELTYLSFSGGGNLTRKWQEYAQSKEYSDFPVILEPSAYKYTDRVYEILEPQWSTFLRRLCEATLIVIIGYSLPDIDSEARSKILTAFQINDQAKWFVVDPSPEICARYERLLGKERLRTFPTSLAGFNNELVANLEQAFVEVPF
jgi:hypothetical protein